MEFDELLEISKKLCSTNESLIKLLIKRHPEDTDLLIKLILDNHVVRDVLNSQK